MLQKSYGWVKDKSPIFLISIRTLYKLFMLYNHILILIYLFRLKANFYIFVGMNLKLYRNDKPSKLINFLGKNISIEESKVHQIHQKASTAMSQKYTRTILQYANT